MDLLAKTFFEGGYKVKGFYCFIEEISSIKPTSLERTIVSMP